jgi:hypothetical protein
MLFKRSMVIVLAAGGLGAVLIAPAQAYTSSNTVSCDTAYTDSLVTLAASGAVSVKQNDTNPDTNRYHWATSSNGNSLSKESAVDGTTVSWSSVVSSNYTFKTTPTMNVNCNGILPGNGNTSLTYTVTP